MTFQPELLETLIECSSARRTCPALNQAYGPGSGQFCRDRPTPTSPSNGLDKRHIRCRSSVLNLILNTPRPARENDPDAGEKRKRLETPVLLKDLKTLPSHKPWESGFGDPLEDYDDDEDGDQQH